MDARASERILLSVYAVNQANHSDIRAAVRPCGHVAVMFM